MSKLLTERTSWQALQQHASQLKRVSLRELNQDPRRFQDFSRQANGFLLDLSKQHLTQDTLQLLYQLAQECQLDAKIAAKFSGARVNATEERPALHSALRLPAHARLQLDGQEIVTPIHASLDKMAALVAKLHARQWRGVSGYPITDIVNLGVGGSELGPLMATHALHEWRPQAAQHLNIHFASTMDGSQLATALSKLNPKTTLFIISSKSFTTLDTLSNANTALHWLEGSLGAHPSLKRQHFIGVSAHPERMQAWGIAKEHQLTLWDWVGGRYSLWSCIGLPIALSLGMAHFKALLAGAHQLDLAFQQAPWQDNLAVLMALVGIWNINFLGIHTLAILPYDGRLAHFPDYLAQLEMESNGKSVNTQGQTLDYATCPILWGGVGPNAQHAFYQLLHQGTQRVACDFIATAQRYQNIPETQARLHLQNQHQMTLANCFAQSRLLMLGDAAAPEPRPEAYRRYRGEQPSTTLMFESLTPFQLGALIALYEHKVFVQACIWGINPFDQWGVELGKHIAHSTQAALIAKEAETFDPSTQGLLAYCHAL
ncbi:glucose-6-phosphate isomerase [Allopseudospirillum japonicum]|uniref:Glucose-6-phosphate isomerase n=1 Tax=Allopseudospirillum japonicum TaxID=64971 RepID=A0A1H6QPR8_9GAMM|nr:glucose-6-phosphate isomerase [Allopseudospirillum japonicum]SEI41440.1 glucose-6-phosphate isomerase [Allopseudospirillum japonicum]